MVWKFKETPLVKNFQLTKDKIVALTAGIVQTAGYSTPTERLNYREE